MSSFTEENYSSPALAQEKIPHRMFLEFNESLMGKLRIFCLAKRL
jgi:hypothetical protein